MKNLSVALCYLLVCFTFPSIDGRRSAVSLANISLDLSNFFGGIAGGPVVVDVGEISGHPRIILSHAKINLVTLESSLELNSPELKVFGNYSWPGIISFADTAGKINVTLRNFTAKLGLLQTIDSLLISDIRGLVTSYEGEPVVNLTNNVFFQNQRNVSMRQILNKNSESLNKQIKAILLKMGNDEIENFRRLFQKDNPKSMEKLLQQLIRSLDLDRIHLPDLSRSILGINFKVTDLILNGLSNIDKIHTLLMEYRDKRITSNVNVAFSQLMISYKLSFLNMKFLEEKRLQDAGVSFHLIVNLEQEIPPQLKDFRLSFESLQKIKDGYVKGIVGLTYDVLKDISDGIRRTVFQALNSVLNKIIQEELNKVKVEEVVAKFINKLART